MSPRLVDSSGTDALAHPMLYRIRSGPLTDVQKFRSIQPQFGVSLSGDIPPRVPFTAIGPTLLPRKFPGTFVAAYATKGKGGKVKFPITRL